MSSSRARCHQFQDRMARKRDRDFWHQQKWDQQAEYYRRFDKVNSKFDDWTSPRYYESNTEMVERLRKERDKKELLEKRREKLRRLLAEDDATYEIEIMMSRAKGMERERAKVEDVPTEILRDVNVGIKVEEDERKRKEAETKLYQKWRRDNPALREAERDKAAKDVKLSWLDQQIEKRMRKEREEEECKRYLKERDENIQQRKIEEQIVSEEVQRKNDELKNDLLNQIREMNLKQTESDELRRSEDEEVKTQNRVFDFQEKLRQQEVYKKNKEVAIYNLKQHRMKLKNLSRQIRENLDDEHNMISEIIKSRTAERIRDLKAKEEVKTALDELLKFTKEQKELEKKRQSYLDFIFDSEAKSAYEKQTEIWRNEELSRKNLLKDVLSTIEQQINENIIKSQEKQKQLILEREKQLEKIEAYEKEIEENRKLESEKKLKIREQIEKDIKFKNLKERRLKDLERRNYDEELENMKREEERLKKEIMKIQNSHAPMRYVKRKPWY